jgi:hypothetical protein
MESAFIYRSRLGMVDQDKEPPVSSLLCCYIVSQRRQQPVSCTLVIQTAKDIPATPLRVEPAMATSSKSHLQFTVQFSKK